MELVFEKVETPQNRFNEVLMQLINAGPGTYRVAKGPKDSAMENLRIYIRDAGYVVVCKRVQELETDTSGIIYVVDATVTTEPGAAEPVKEEEPAPKAKPKPKPKVQDPTEATPEPF